MKNPIQKVAVLGAGTMGAAIAQHFCMKGVTVTLSDLKEAALERGRRMILENLEDARAKKILSEDEFKNCLGRLKLTLNQADLSDSDLIVEAVFEDLQIKKNVFSSLEKIVRSDCILASNTSSFLVADIAQGLKNPERVVGVHYFYHAAKNKLVEIIPGKLTKPELPELLSNFYASCDKTPILVKDAPGFAINRFFVPWLNEAARLWEEGFGSISFIDEVAREDFGIGMGPFALMNATGVPIAQHAAEGLASKLGKYYLPAEGLRRQVSAGNNWELSDTTVQKSGKNDREAVMNRLFAASLGIAAQMVDEGVTNASFTDLGARVGLRWPMGPFEMMKVRKFDTDSLELIEYFKKWDLKVPSKKFSLNWVFYEQSGDSAFITFTAPDRMNPINEDVVRELTEYWSQIEANPQVKKVYFSGQGKAFVAGADVKFFVDSIEQNQIEKIYQFTRTGQELLRRIAESTKTSIAYINGLTLGGGLELALSCKYRIATKKAIFGFPETGIGIYPGLGGTQRAPRLIGKGLAKFLIATGQMLNAKTAWEYGLVDELVDPVFDLKELARNPLPKHQSGRKQEGLSEIEFAGFNGILTEDLFSGEIYKKHEKALRRKAPLALIEAMGLVDRGETKDINAAIELELEGTRKVFASKDAAIGLKSILTRTKPEFTGA
jgi:enoyl-CoA hydratase / 3-hydroxyacyl-CoA dehydrogenase